MSRFARRLIGPVVALGLGAALPVQAQTQGPGGNWTFSVTPYLWLPSVNGTLAFEPPSGGGGPEVGVGPNDWLEDLNGVFMISGEARQGPWAIFGDYIYLDFQDEASRIRNVEFGGSRVPVAAEANLDTRSELRGSLFMLAASHSVVDDPRYTLELFGGLRYLTLKASVDWRLSAGVTAPSGGASFASTGQRSQREELWDGIVGARGRVRVGQEGKWFMPYALDLGTGTSRFTWQALAGVGYSFGWGDVLLAYRHLSYDMDDGKLLQDLRFGGAAVGATFRF